MPRERLEFVPDGLSVAYRASAEPQIVRVRFVSKSPPSQNDVLRFQSLLDAVEGGLAGGAEFAPWASKMEYGGPPSVETTALGTATLIPLKVRAVSPLFVRHMVEELRYLGGDAGIVELSIFGDLAPDGGPLSVREADVRAWLDDPNAFPGRYSSLGFPYRVDRRARGATLRVTLGEPLTSDASDWLEGAYCAWLAGIRRWVTTTGVDPEDDAVGELPRIGVRRDEFWVWSRDLFRSRGPAADALLNALGKVHAERVKLAEVVVGL